VRENPKDVEAWLQYADVYMYVYVYTHTHTYIHSYRSRVRENPKDVEAWLQYADVYLQKGQKMHDKELALHVLSNALDVNQTSVALWLYYLDVFETVENKDEVCVCV
jgi:cytochrome c-type biogenesis protein CcmH/NrfG